MLNNATDKRVKSDSDSKLLEQDYYFNDHGFMVFTENYHKKRGYCCKNICLHCPWNYRRDKLKV